MRSGVLLAVDHAEMIELQLRQERIMQDVNRMHARNAQQLVHQIAARYATNVDQGLPKSSIMSIPERKYKSREEKDDCSICCTEL